MLLVAWGNWYAEAESSSASAASNSGTAPSALRLACEDTSTSGAGLCPSGGIDDGNASSPVPPFEGFGPMVKSSVAQAASNACGKVSFVHGWPLTFSDCT